MVNALVLAGSSSCSSLEELMGVDNKAFIPVGGKPLFLYVLDALAGSSKIKATAVVGPERQLLPLAARYKFKVVQQRGDLMENLVAGSDAFSGEDRLLVVAGDIPMLTTAGIDDFLTRCEPMDMDFYYSIISKDACLKRFPGVERTFVALRDGSFTGGNVFLINPRVIPNVYPKVKDLLENRKNPIKMASLLGLGLMLGFVTRQLTIEKVEKKVGNILNLKAKAVISPFAELGTDVDKVSDLRLAEKELALPGVSQCDTFESG